MNKILGKKSIKKQIQKINGGITFCCGITVLPVGRDAVFGSCGFRRRCGLSRTAFSRLFHSRMNIT